MKIQVGRKYVRRGIRAKGAVIAETAASMLVLVPVLFLILFAVLDLFVELDGTT